MMKEKDFLAFKQQLSQTVSYEQEAGHTRYKIKEKDGSTSLYFELGQWKYHDNYFGGEPYGGREVVWHEGKPVHMTVYYGWVDGKEDLDIVYSFLREALRANPDVSRSRGPQEFKKEKLVYCNKYAGDIGRFSGKESIYRNQQLIYQATYAGGWVDRRRGD